jgi:16S rRNA processing protein RimM
MEDSLVWVGRIVKTQGIKGEVRVSSPGGGVAAFSPGKTVYLENGQGGKRSLTVHSSRAHGKFIILSFREIKQVQEAAELVGYSVYVPKESLEALPPDEFYDYQLRGLTVKTEGGVLLGILEEIIPTGTNDVFVVRKEGREVLIPATDEVVVRVDLREKTMVIHPLEGLLSEDDL